MGLMRCDLWTPEENQAFIDFYMNNSSEATAVQYNVRRKSIQRWARRFGLPRKNRFRSDYEDLQLTQIQSEVMQGCLLGDGCLDKLRSKKSNSSLFVAHGESQRSWAEWKCNILNPFSRKFRLESRTARKRLPNNKVIADPTRNYIIASFYTMRHPVFTELEKKWYKRDEHGNYVFKKIANKLCRIKIVPADLKLTKLGMAVWFLDDAHNKVKSKRHEIYTLAFDDFEVERLVDQIKSLGLTNCWSQDYHRGGKYIVVDKDSHEGLVELVKEQIVDFPSEMMYKLALRKAAKNG